MVRVTVQFGDDQSTTVEMPCALSQVDAEIQKLLNVPGDFAIGGQRIVKNFRGYSFE
jgi:hypothetical protein